MPCIYAHNSFGKEVQKILPKPLKNTIRRHPAAFRIGLQGPDFLFFYHPLLKCKTNQLGYHQHSHAFDAFLAYELPIIRKLGTSFSKSWARRFGILCGVGFLAFGFVSKRILILPLMLVLPLLLKLPEYFVMEQENVLVDLLGVKEQRAAALSVLNMGVSIIEILALFASAALTAAGIGWCFLGVGVLLIVCMLCVC